jgi:hypothetical protein
MTAMTLTIERVRAFNGLDVLVANEEGLFAQEGLDLRIAVPAPADIRPVTDGTLLKPITNQGRVQARGAALLFTG